MIFSKIRRLGVSIDHSKLKPKEDLVENYKFINSFFAQWLDKLVDMDLFFVSLKVLLQAATRPKIMFP